MQVGDFPRQFNSTQNVSSACSVPWPSMFVSPTRLPYSLQSAVGSRLPAPLSPYLPPGLSCLSHVVSRLLSGQLPRVDFGLPPLSAQKSQANVTSIMRHLLICSAARCPSLPPWGLWSFLIDATVWSCVPSSIQNLGS